MKGIVIGAGICAALAFASPVLAKVVSAAPGGFKVTQEVEIAAKPDKVWEALLHPANWWSSDHSWSGNAKNITIEAKAGGCWCETWAGGSARHMTVIYVAPGKEIRFSGALGPLQFQGVSGSLVWTIEPSGTGTKVTWTNTVGGYSDPPLDALAGPVDRVELEQLNALKASLEAKAN